MKILQQGDLLLKANQIPKMKEKELIVNPILQHGEHTGHKHMLTFRHDSARVGSGDYQFQVIVDKQSGKRYLDLKAPSDLVHEEHKTIMVPPGQYEIGIVQEYDHLAEEARQVQD